METQIIIRTELADTGKPLTTVNSSDELQLSIVGRMEDATIPQKIAALKRLDIKMMPPLQTEWRAPTLTAPPDMGSRNQ